jgi:hypothetical protein
MTIIDAEPLTAATFTKPYSVHQHWLFADLCG